MTTKSEGAAAGNRRRPKETNLTSIFTDSASRVKAAVDIVAVVGDYVTLKKAGPSPRHVGLCPFHKEKTPSFSVDANRQNYHCFGCQLHGDVFDFVARIEGIDFRGALRLLADRAGIPLRRSPLTSVEKRDFARRRAGLDQPAGRRSRIPAEVRLVGVLPLRIFSVPAHHAQLVRLSLGPGQKKQSERVVLLAERAVPRAENLAPIPSVLFGDFSRRQRGINVHFDA